MKKKPTGTAAGLTRQHVRDLNTPTKKTCPPHSRIKESDYEITGSVGHTVMVCVRCNEILGTRGDFNLVPTPRKNEYAYSRVRAPA